MVIGSSHAVTTQATMFRAGRFRKVAGVTEAVGIEEDGIVGILSDMGEDVCWPYDVFLTGG